MKRTTHEASRPDSLAKSAIGTPSRPGFAPAQPLIQLQHTAGNRAIGNLIQAKYKIGPAGDSLEREADLVADQVTAKVDPAASGSIESTAGRPGPPQIQRACAQCDDEPHKEDGNEEDEALQAKTNGGHLGTTDPNVESAVDALKGGGESLPVLVREYFEPRFGRDFGGVRIHTGADAAESASALNALAYTVGSDIAFADGKYSPQTQAGQRLLAHELTHVVQQGHSGSSSPGVIQRQPVPETESTTDGQPEREAVRPRSMQGPLIVEDDSQQMGAGQMRKSEFLSRVRSEVCRQSEEAMQGTGRTTEGCPYVEKWFGYYEEKDSSYIERSLKKYAPEAVGATSAIEYIPLVAVRVRRSVEVWARTGEITGVPEELAGAVTGGGILGAIGSVVSGIGSTIGNVVSAVAGGIGSAISGIGRLLFKGKEGGAIPAGNAQPPTGQLTGGRSLDSAVKQRMETAFGRDFSAVRIHTDNRAAEESTAMNARAFTVGGEIAFGPGEYQPGTMIGDALIAHELAHVVQQSGAGINGAVVQMDANRSSGFEEDADISAANAVASIWGDAYGGLRAVARTAMPRLRSGLKLQRCPSGPQPVPPSAAGATVSKLMIDAPGMQGIIDQMWQESVADPLNPREYSVTVIRNSQTGQIIRVNSEKGPVVFPGQTAHVAVCLPPETNLGPNETVWGTIHTHPLPAVEAYQEPLGDVPIASNMDPALCGTEQYVISTDTIWGFDRNHYWVVRRR